MVGDDAAVFADEKSCAEDVDLKMRTRSAGIELHHALIIDDRFAEAVNGDLNRLAGLAVEKFDNNVQQANARRIGVDDGLGDFAFGFECFQARLRVGKLLLQRSGF